MARSARRPRRSTQRVLIEEAASAIGAAVARNPVLVGSGTAFLVALSFVSANALWYQPHFHDGAFFATRSQAYARPDLGRRGLGRDEPETTFRLVRPQETAAPKPDETVKMVQSALAGLDLYEGPVDGIRGPNTRGAVAAYRERVGLPAGDAIDAALLAELGGAPTTAAVGPTPEPAPRDEPGAPAAGGDPTVARIQAGLKAFGNEGIEVDGVMGSRTESAIREFQTLFGLKVTGQPDAALVAKMKDVGLTGD